jgi:hypothetical protein
VRQYIPPGCRVVPKYLTPEMRHAAKRAMKEYIDKMPPETRARMPRRSNGEILIPTNLKYDLRYMAAIKAAPEVSMSRRRWFDPFCTRAFWHGFLDGMIIFPPWRKR